MKVNQRGKVKKGGVTNDEWCKNERNETVTVMWIKQIVHQGGKGE